MTTVESKPLTGGSTEMYSQPIKSTEPSPDTTKVNSLSKKPIHHSVPHHEPDKAFICSVLGFQIFFIIMYAIASEYPRPSQLDRNGNNEQLGGLYAMFQDVHVMMFIGFGFLMTFLRKYGFSAIGINFLLCAFCLQWSMFCYKEVDVIFGKHIHKLHISVDTLLIGDISTATILISFGAVLGRTTPHQLLWMAFIEVIFYSINGYIVEHLLHVKDVGGSILIHTFGAYFGLSVSWMLGRPTNDTENKSMYHSDIFAMIGTLFLWMFWPSFNGYLAPIECGHRERSYINTILSLSSCVLATFGFSNLFKGEFNMVHVQNATLAGGVAMGAAANFYLHPAGAMGVGFFAGFISTFGFSKLQEWLDQKINLLDTCGVNNLHGMPGIFGGIVSAIAVASAQGTSLYNNDTCSSYYSFEHKLSKQGGYQIAGICVTLGISILSGLCTGGILRKFFSPPVNPFNDTDNWEVPDTKVDFFRGTIRGAEGFGI